VIKVYAKYQTTMITFSTTISLISLAGKFVENHCHKTLAAIASLLNLTFHWAWYPDVRALISSNQLPTSKVNLWC